MNEIDLRFTHVCWAFHPPFLSYVLGFDSPLLVCFVFGGDKPLNSWFDGLFVTILILLAKC